MPPRVPPTRVAQVERMLRTGSYFTYTAEECGVTNRTVRRIAKRLGIRPPTRQSDATLRGVELVRRGYSYTRAAFEVGVYPNTVIHACRKAGVVSRYVHPSVSP